MLDVLDVQANELEDISHNPAIKRLNPTRELIPQPTLNHAVQHPGA